MFLGRQFSAAVLGVDLRGLGALPGLPGSTFSTSSSVSSRACLPETSSLWIAASSIRSVAVRNLSLLFIASVRSDRKRSFSSAMPHYAAGRTAGGRRV